MGKHVPASCIICGYDYQKFAKGSYICSNGHMFLVIERTWFGEYGPELSLVGSNIPQEPLETRITPISQVFQDAFKDGELEL